jgi:hypothetical protein
MVFGALVLLAGTVCSPAAPQGQDGSQRTQSAKPPAAAKAASSPSAPKPSPTPDPAGRAQPASGECPPSHLLKGATSASGERLYYEPDADEYASITPEICFTAGGDARSNGYIEARR